MIITKITKKNAESFIPLLPEFVTDSQGYLCIGAVDDEGRAAAALCARVDFQIIYLMSLYVVPGQRRKGYGTELINTLASLTRDSDYIAITVYFPPNPAAAGFFTHSGFEVIEGMRIYSIPFGEFFKGPMVKKYIMNCDPSKVKYISELNESEKSELSRQLIQLDIPARGFYDPEWSTAIFSGEKPESILLMNVMDNYINLVALILDEKKPRNVLKHLKSLADKVQSDEKCAKGKSLRFDETFLKPLVRLTGRERYIKEAGRRMQGVRPL